MRVAGEAEEGFFESGCGSLTLEGGRSVERDEFALSEDGDAVGEELDFGKRVRCKEQRSCAGLQDMRFQKLAKRRGGDGVQASGWFVKQENGGRVKQSASEAEALNGTGRKSAHLAIEGFGEFELRGEVRDATAGCGRGEMIEAAKEKEVFAGGKAGVKALVGARVVAEGTANGARRSGGVMAGDGGVPRSGEKKRRENAEKGGLAGAVCAEQGKGLADFKFE